MIVTDKEYFLEKLLVEKIDLCIKRCTGKNKLDNLMIVDGDEGFGKTTLAVAMAYYVHHKTGRPFSVDNIFFDIESMLKFALNNQDQIIVWDEAALGGLSMQWQSKDQQKLVQMLMVARKKRHFYFFNIPKFFKLNEYIFVDRSIGLCHVYARNETELGRFCYLKKKNKEKLFYDFRKSKIRNYRKRLNFWGTFPNILGKLIDEVEYDKKKDKAILSITDKADTPAGYKKKYMDQSYIITQNFKVKKAMEIFGWSKDRYYKNKNHPIYGENTREIGNSA